MLEVMLTKIEKMYGGNKILRGATFPVLTGEKVGLVGRNRSGKTTLLKIIAGLETYDSGDLTTRNGASVGYLDQMPELTERSKAIDDDGRVSYGRDGEVGETREGHPGSLDRTR
ncbi:putative ABC transporter ATP-binding proteinc [Peptococcaceae bacterium CEB3]|nr:putative ABC transporter ATP-binding proteinc [Peptococcaceae bacterium CEB3]